MMADYKVGYRKPPEHSKFKKGQSGNASGRPRKPKYVVQAHKEPMKTIFLQEIYRPVRITENGRTIEMPLIRAVARRVGVSAAQGNQRAARLILDTAGAIEQENFEAHIEHIKYMSEYKWGVSAEYERRKKLDPSTPAPVPHPDDILFNTRTGE